MVTILYADVSGCDESALIELYIGSADAYHRGRISAYKPARSKALSLAAAALMQVGVRAMTETGGLDTDLFSTGDDGIAYLSYDDFLVLYEPLKLTYGKGEFGKPFLKEYSGLKFSISHSNGIAVVSLSTEETGMDVQYHRPTNFMRIAERFFSSAEIAFLQSVRQRTDEKRCADIFHDLWAAKEAYVKYTGEGLFKPFDDFEAQLHYEGLPLTGVIEPDGASLLYPIAIPDYSFCLCTLEPPDVRVLRVELRA